MPAPVASDGPLIADPIEVARAAGLRYVSDARPGLHRLREGDEFRYVDSRGHTVDDPATLERIRKLAIPPAWTDVWISPDPRGHIQATARDAKGRKQYRYHARWREVRDEAKYERTLVFAEALPAIRAQTTRDLAKRGLPREKVLAALVQMLEKTHIRVGNDEYARQNEHYGLTTLRTDHVEVEGRSLRFRFVGKSGKEHRIGLNDRRLAVVVAKLQDLPGQELFQYLDDDGHLRAVTSDDVNAYLREISGQDFSAKDFRTWAGTVLAARALQEMEQVDAAARTKKNVVRAVEAVAKRLGNTPSVCRKCYVHPGVIDAYLDGALVAATRQEADDALRDDLPQLPPEEAAVLALLRERLALEAEPSAKAG